MFEKIARLIIEETVSHKGELRDTASAIARESDDSNDFRIDLENIIFKEISKRINYDVLLKFVKEDFGVNN